MLNTEHPKEQQEIPAVVVHNNCRDFLLLCNIRLLVRGVSPFVSQYHTPARERPRIFSVPPISSL